MKYFVFLYNVKITTQNQFLLVGYIRELVNELAAEGIYIDQDTADINALEGTAQFVARTRLDGHDAAGIIQVKFNTKLLGLAEIFLMTVYEQKENGKDITKDDAKQMLTLLAIVFGFSVGLYLLFRS